MLLFVFIHRATAADSCRFASGWLTAALRRFWGSDSGSGVVGPGCRSVVAGRLLDAVVYPGSGGSRVALVNHAVAVINRRLAVHRPDLISGTLGRLPGRGLRTALDASCHSFLTRLCRRPGAVGLGHISPLLLVLVAGPAG